VPDFPYATYRRPPIQHLAEPLATLGNDPKPIPPDPGEWARFEAADLQGRWEILVAYQPALNDLLQQALMAHDLPGDEWFYAEAYWYGYSAKPSLRQRVSDLVGWTVDHLDGLLGSTLAYNVATDVVHGALPDCRGDCPCLLGQ